MLASDENEEGERDAYIRRQVITAAVSTLARDYAGQYPGYRSRKTKNLFDAGSL